LAVFHLLSSTSHSPVLPSASYEKCEYELYIERVKEFAKLRKQQLLVSVAPACSPSLSHTTPPPSQEPAAK
jgi:hypothetical protein